jgi:PAS domain S-box-containing protein
VSLSTRLAVAMVAMVLITAAVLGFLTYRNTSAVAVPRGLERIDTHARLVALDLEASVRGARADVVGFRSAVAVFEIIKAHVESATDPTAHAREVEWRRRLADRFAAELAAKPTYYSFRIIGADDNGRELVRVDRTGSDGAIRIVPDAELQEKGAQETFKETIKLPAGAVYVSPIELQQENSVTVTPYVPVLRIATPLHMPDSRPFGIVIINVDMRAPFARVRSAALEDRPIYVVNDRGDYLVHSDPSREFGFELGRPFRIQDEFPQFASLLGAGDTAARVIQNNGGESFGLGWNSVQLANGPRVAVIETLPYSQLVATASAARDSSLLGGAGAVLAGIVLAVLLARSLTRPLVQMRQAVEGFGSGQAAVVPTNASGEIGVLARAFARMIEEVREKSAALTREGAARQRLFETSVDLILIVDRQGNFLQVSPSSRAILGYDPKEMVGYSATAFIFPDDLDSTRDEMRSARRGRLTRNFECRYVHKEGRVVLLQWTGVWSEMEQQHYFIGRDTTEHRLAEEKFRRESEERQRLFDILNNTINSMVDGVLVADVTGKVVLANPAAERLSGIVAGLDPAEWSEPNELLQPDGVSKISFDQRPLARAVRGEVVENYQITVRNKIQDKIFQVIANGGPIRDSANQIKGAVVIYRDVTESRETERQLRQAQKMEAVGELTGGIAHDFNNILTVITGTIEILAESVADKPALATIAKMIDEAAGRGADLTQRLLAFARRQPLQPREIDVNTLIVDTTKLLRPTLGEHIEIESMLADDLPPALVDPNQLTTALINLALNARDAMPGGGKLVLETKNTDLDENYAKANAGVLSGPYVMIAVSDTGTGIPAEIRDRVFEPFFTTKEVGRGTGLGLSMVYGFVKQSNGHIKIYSEEGHGTTIKLYLPRTVGMAQALEVVLAAPAETGSETILVVEDDDLVRNYVVTQLDSLGYQVLTAANAAAALTIIDSVDKLDLLFTDVIMPGAMNGRQLSDEALKRRPSLKVLFTSGYTQNAIVHHGRLDAGVLLLAKPYRKVELARMIRQALSAKAGGAG